MTVLTVISVSLLYVAMAMNLIAFALNTRGYMRYRELVKSYGKEVSEYREAKEELKRNADEYLARIEDLANPNLNENYKENENDERKNEYPSSTDGIENT